MTRSNLVPALFVIASGCLLFGAAEVLIPGTKAQQAPAVSAWKDLLSAHRIDGSTLSGGWAYTPPEGSGGGSAELNVDSPPVLMDGYTARVSEVDGSAPETNYNENYIFSRPTTGTSAIRFEFPIKVPRAGLPGNFGVDVVIFPSRNRTGALLGGEDMPPSPSPRVWIDDFIVGNPGSFTSAYPTVGFFTVENLESLLGTGDFDWLAVADFNSNSLSDTDGNGRPDIGLETIGGTVTLRLSPSIDEVGASLIEFFAGNVNKVNVYEAAGSQPPARSGYGGMQAGETGVTRPWSFRIN